MSRGVPSDVTASTAGAGVERRPRAALERGACVDRYIVVDKLGTGGMGVVYKAFDPELGRTVGLKLLNTDHAGAGILRDRLLREAQALARLSHPNVVAVHDVGTFEDNIFVAMEFVEGQTLRQWLKGTTRGRREVLAVFRAAGEGLAAAHRANLIHRDFKPENVIVGSDGRVRVLDFGLARDATSEVGSALADAPSIPPSVPPSVRVDEAVEALRERIARGQALWSAGRDADGLAWMKSVGEQAKAAHHLPTEAQALTVLGGFQWSNGDLTAADVTLKQALLAAEGGKVDATAAQACIWLVRTWGDRDPGSPEGLLFGDHASAWLMRLGGSAPKLEVDLEVGLGGIYRNRGEFAQARAHYQRGLAIAERALGPDSAEAARTLSGLSLVLYDFGQLEDSLRYGERALSILEKALGPQHPSVGETLTNLSMDLLELGRLDEAVRVLRRADENVRSASSRRALGNIQSNLASVYELQGRYGDALRTLRAALAEKTDMDGYLMSGIASVLNRQGRFAEALPVALQALAMQERVYAGPNPDVGDALLGIGVAHLGLGRPGQAIAPLERADGLANLQRRLHGRIRLALAQALEGSRRGELVRVGTLMTQARDDLLPTPEINAKELAQIESWRSRHRQ